MKKIEFVKWLSRTAIILSISLLLFGIYLIMKDAEIFEGIVFIF
jgi:hypothetical protein